MKKYLNLAATVALALPMLVFGLNKLLSFASMPPPEGEEARVFLTAMFTTYLVKVVAWTEIIGGALLLYRRTSFLGVLLLLPVVFNIAAFHIAHDMPGNGIWIVTTALYAVVAYIHKNQFKTLAELCYTTEKSGSLPAFQAA